MASHVVVIDTTARSAKIKTSPDKHLTAILEEACSKLGRDASRFGLKYNGKNVDLSRTIRLSGLSSGARLELVASSRSPSPVSVALQLPEVESNGTSRLTDKFSSDTTLWLILRKFESAEGSMRNFTGRGAPVIGEGGSGAGRLYFETPVIQVMGREFASFTDLQKTLAQLGFNSGSALLRLGFRKTDTPLEDAMTEIGQYFKSVQPQDSEALSMDKSLAQTTETPTKDGVGQNSGDAPQDHSLPSNNPSIPSAVIEANDSDRVASPDNTLTAGPSLRPVTVFAPPSSSTPKAARQAFNEKDFEPTIDHAKLHQQRLKANSQNQRLPTDAEIAAQLEAQVQRNAQIKEVKVKVRFPDQSQVEAPFSNLDTAKGLYDHVRNLMQHAEEPFSLSYTTGKGPKQVPHNSDARLIRDLGMAGRVLVNFVWNEGATSASRLAPTLKEQFRQRAQEIEVKEIEGVEIEEPRPSKDKSDKTTEDKSRKGGVPKWLKLPGKK